MKKALLCLVAASAVIILGCSGSGPGAQTSSEKEYGKLYKQYSAKFHEKMAKDADTMRADEIAAQAIRIWDETFGPHKAILKQRAAEILKELDAGPPIVEGGEKSGGDQTCTIGGTLYIEIARIGRNLSAAQPTEGVMKHLLWNPLNAAQMSLNFWLNTILPPRVMAMRTLTSSHAGLTWEVADPNPDKPKLVLRQGPVVFTVDLSRVDDYYQVDQMRMLRPKTMKSIFAPDVTPPATKPAETPAEKPAETPAERPAEKPAEKPAAAEPAK